MSRHKKNRHKEMSVPSDGKRRFLIASASILAVAIVVALGLLWTPNRTAKAPVTRPRAETKVPTSPAAPTTPAATPAIAPATKVATKADFQKLQGKWRRPDGGYVLEIKSVTDSGTLDATYANPQPIHVAKAEASQEDKAIKVFIELRDVNYPGSTYDLTYDPPSDSLQGIYYQAALQQQFDVVFVRTNQ
jgi:cytoskeletal protein RodZ